MDQPVPKVDDADVERVVRRDFPKGRQAEVRTLLEQYGESSGMIPPPRVRLAILKLSGGDPKKVARYVSDALMDSRDVVAWAEYSRYSNAGSDVEVKRAIEDDWKEYQNWLDAKANQ
jgi:hypothetical protein